MKQTIYRIAFAALSSELMFIGLILVVIASHPAEAGRRRRTASAPAVVQSGSPRIQLKLARVQLRTINSQNGVTLTRARTGMYAMQSVANVTGFFSPFGIIANLIGRSQGF